MHLPCPDIVTCSSKLEGSAGPRAPSSFLTQRAVRRTAPPESLVTWTPSAHHAARGARSLSRHDILSPASDPPRLSPRDWASSLSLHAEHRLPQRQYGQHDLSITSATHTRCCESSMSHTEHSPQLSQFLPVADLVYDTINRPLVPRVAVPQENPDIAHQPQLLLSML